MTETGKIRAVEGRLDGLLSGLSFHLVVNVFPVSDCDNHYFFSLIVDMTNYPVVPDPGNPYRCQNYTFDRLSISMIFKEKSQCATQRGQTYTFD